MKQEKFNIYILKVCINFIYIKDSFHLLINSFVNGIELELNTLKT